MTAKQLRASRKIPPGNEQLMAEAAAALEKWGTIEGAAAELRVHRHTVKHAIVTCEVLNDAWTSGRSKRRERIEAESDERAGELYTTLKTQFDEVQAKIDEKETRLNKDYVKLYANDITKLLTGLKELRTERSAINRKIKARFHHDGTPRK